MNPSDWSSDVCSSDLEKCDEKKKGKIFEVGMSWSLRDLCWSQLLQFGTINRSRGDQIGRASCRERV